MKRFDVVGIGNAIVDVFNPCDDTFLDLMGIEKGIMQLVERDRAEVLYGAMRGPQQEPGGSVANTLSGLGNLGLRRHFWKRCDLWHHAADLREIMWLQMLAFAQDHRAEHRILQLADIARPVESGEHFQRIV